MNEFVCPEIRFKFYNGKKTYTVEHHPAGGNWYIFDEETAENALAVFRPKKGMRVRFECDPEQAAFYLNKYFKSINSEYYTT